MRVQDSTMSASRRCGSRDIDEIAFDRPQEPGGAGRTGEQIHVPFEGLLKA